VKRIGIVGSDNSHAIAYSKLVNIEKIVGDEAAVVGIWGAEPERTQEVAGLGQIPAIYDSPEALLPDVDVVFVVDRHGDLHKPHALPFLEAGIDTYVDKPFAIALDDIREMQAAAAKSGAFLHSGSSLRITPDTDALMAQVDGIGEIVAAQIAGPMDIASVYGGPFFYATHAAELALRILGDDLESLAAERTGETTVVNATWAGERQVTFTYLNGAAYWFGATVFGTKGVAHQSVRANDDGYAAIVKLVLGSIADGTRPLTDTQLLLPVVFVHALQQSLANGGARVPIASVLGA
jgi:predicted dehydrogenase